MAKKQTRRSISMQRAKHGRLVELSKRTGIPAAQIVEQALEAVHDGRIQLEPAISNAERRERGGDGRWAEGSEPEIPIVHPVRPPRPRIETAPVTGTCAVCVEDIGTNPERPGSMRPEGRGGALVKVCYGCTHEEPQSGRHSFKSGASPGMAPGCRWTSSRGVGQ